MTAMFIKATTRNQKKIEFLNVANIEKFSDAKDKIGGTVVEFASGRHEIYLESTQVFIDRILALTNTLSQPSVKSETAAQPRSPTNEQKESGGRYPGGGTDPTWSGNPGGPVQPRDSRSS